MLSLALPGRVFLYTTPTDMRTSFDGLSAVVRDHLGYDPLAGDLFVFRNRRGIDSHSFTGTRTDWPSGPSGWRKARSNSPTRWGVGPGGIEVRATDLALILGGVDLRSARRRKRYRRPTPA